MMDRALMAMAVALWAFIVLLNLAVIGVAFWAVIELVLWVTSK